ncbi:unnamed protein product [Rotaria sordida]|uniref:Cullin family profile domain-containing protein n=1 Tax=Rotaria sordida TaxID=392033 RepID=A0A819IJB8_9BILA|nr:unnamed protein product [Rotaria sordida]
MLSDCFDSREESKYYFGNMLIKPFVIRCDEREYRNIDDDIATTKLVYNELKRRGMVTTYEIVILLLFNKRSSWTVEQMQDETQINVNLFLQILYNLLKSLYRTIDEDRKMLIRAVIVRTMKQ